MDPCAEQETKDLEVSGLFDLSTVRPFLILSSTLLSIHWLMVILFLGVGAYKGDSR